MNVKLRIMPVIAAAFLAFAMLMTAADTVFAEQINELPDKYGKIDRLDDADNIIGADVTRYQQQKNEWEKTWKDYNGERVDLFGFLKSQGINTVSVKIAVRPVGDESFMSLENAVSTAKEAKAAGLNVNAVLLYSDVMTYGNKQDPPAGWAGSDADQMLQKASEYTGSVLDEFCSSGAAPDIVTIGNEVNYNFLGFTGDDAWNGWNILRQLSGTVKTYAEDNSLSIRVAYSFAAPEDPEDIQWIISGDNLNNTWNPADYDYIGVNLYGDTYDAEYLEALKAKYHDTQSDDHKNAGLYISRISYPYISETDRNVDLYSQMEALYGLMEGISGDCGFIYDEADLAGGWSSLFGDDGCAVPTLGLIDFAVTGETEAVIDPYRYGGEFGFKGIKGTIKPIEGMTDSTIRGVDVSSYPALLKAGVKFYDSEGNEAPLMQVLSDNGVNYVRIRVWNDPYNADGAAYGGGTNDVETGLQIARDAAEYGIKVELCIHYSDFWADPSQQILPKAWQDDAADTKKLRQDVYDFTSETIRKFKETGVEIGMVQIGNEITRGAFGIMMKKGENYSDFWDDPSRGGVVVSCLQSGISAARENCPDALIAMHLDAASIPARKAVINSFESYNLDYDVMGLSYYPFWYVASKANTPEALTDLAEFAESKGKMICVFETAWPITLKDSDGKTGSIGENATVSAYDVGVQGQIDELSDMYSALAKTNNGLGAFYWEPAWIPVKPGWAYWKYNLKMANEFGTGWAAAGSEGYFNPEKLHYQGGDSWGASTWENLAMFDSNGNPLDSLRFYTDAVPESAKHVHEQIVMIHCADSNGKLLGSYISVKLRPGETKTIELPEIKGYVPKTGSYELSVTGTDTVSAQVTVEYISRLISISEAEVSGISSKTYTGKPLTQKLTVKFDNEVLKEGTDYSVEYKNNTKAGKANVIISGKGHYIGSVTKHFTIKKASNPLKIKARTATVKVKRLRKKPQSLKVSRVIKFEKNGKGKISYKLVSAKKGTRSFRKYFKINKTTGKLTIRKNKKIKKGTYKVKIKAQALGNTNYKASAVKTVTFKIKIK